MKAFPPLYGDGSHTELMLKLDQIWFKKYPERFQLMPDGKRCPRYTCWSSPEARDVWLKKVKFDPTASAEALWKDDTIELFIEDTGTIRRIVFSASGKYSSRLVPEDKWNPVPGLVYTVRNHTQARRMEITLPLTPGMTKNFRFNVGRSRKLTDRTRESTTWSPNAKRSWTDPKGYTAVLVK